MTGTPFFNLPLMSTNDAQKEVLFNEAIIAFDVMAARIVKSIRTTPPVSPVTGDTYLVGVGASGAWAGSDNKIAFYFNGWQFLPTVAKMKMWVSTPGSYYTFSGTAWLADATPPINTLDDLADISLTPLLNGDMLKWDAVASRWKNSPSSSLTSLNALTDVEAGTPGDGQVLSYNSTAHKWVAASLPTHTVVDRLQDLTDVNWTGVGNKKILSWDTTTNKAKWVDPVNPVPSTLAALSDVNIAGATANDALVYNGAVWGPSKLTYNYSFKNMTDGPGTLAGHAGEFMVVDITESFLKFVSVGELLGNSDMRTQNLADMDVINGDNDLNKVPQLYKQSGKYRFKYTTLPTIPTYAVKKDGTNVTAAMASLNFAGFNVANSSNNVTVSPIPLVWQTQNENVSGPQVSKINFRGPGVGVTNVDGVLEVEVAGADSGAGGTYDLAVFYPGTLASVSQEVFRFPAIRPFRILSNFNGSRGSCVVNPSSEVTFTAKKNGTNVGTIKISNTGVFTFSTTSGGVINFAAGDVFEVVGPAIPDGALADFSIAIAGVKT
ncbi:DUF2793 domain-containing protein [Hyphomicrobium sp.]|uniref:DUF2793 domain-containing protein n=1 Tax=Hyphomicrobium sp. TaxID=82 RepID=UPI001DC1645B|nr:DUF2793 domain-containing protein [Hyphomicrobium sp.]MBY0560020.1 DUF2793 domain-containing protein [Hyphomicrobium sp.]